jgi:hypothetical protein
MALSARASPLATPGPRTPAPRRAPAPARAPGRAGRLVARVSSIPSRPAADGPEIGAPPAAGAADRVAAADDHAAPQHAAADAARIAQLQLNVAHVTVDGAALPADHPDHPETGLAAARLIPAHHPEAPQAAAAEAEAAAEAALAAAAAEEQEVAAAPAGPSTQRKPRPQQQQRARDPRFGTPLEPTFSVGDLVWGVVVHNGGMGGARVRLLHHEGVVGFMPASNEPLERRDGNRYSTAKGKPQEQRGLPVGHVRAFKVRAAAPCGRQARRRRPCARMRPRMAAAPHGGAPARAARAQAPTCHPSAPATAPRHQVRDIPKDMTYGGRGPLLSASDADYDLAWLRAQQVRRGSREQGHTGCAPRLRAAARRAHAREPVRSLPAAARAAAPQPRRRVSTAPPRLNRAAASQPRRRASTAPPRPPLPAGV